MLGVFYVIKGRFKRVLLFYTYLRNAIMQVGIVIKLLLEERLVNQKLSLKRLVMCIGRSTLSV